ncbi:MAG: VOC family protein [Clostridia bacterium]|nr:VOC family protein [Clostridia bacterium]
MRRVYPLPFPVLICIFLISQAYILLLREPSETIKIDTHGEGIHHIAFFVKDMDKVIEDCIKEGMTVVQQGNYDDASGRYTYLDGNEQYKCVIELLESF